MKSLRALRFALPVFLVITLGAARAEDAAPGAAPPEPGASAESAPDLIGGWVVTSMGGKPIPEGKPAPKFVFAADGSVVRRIGGSGREEKGTYALSEDGKTLTIDSGDGKEVLKVEELTGRTLVIGTGEEDMVVLARAEAGEWEAGDEGGKKEEGAARDLSGELVGRWKMAVLGGEKVGDDDDTVFEFKADGTVTRTRSGVPQNGTYSLSADKALLTLTRDGESDGDQVEVLTLTDSTLSIKDGGNSMELTRLPSPSDGKSAEGNEGEKGEEGKDEDDGDPAKTEEPTDPKEEETEGEKEPAPAPEAKVKDGKIFGRWQVVAMEGLPEGADKPLFQFNQDGTVTGTMGERVKEGKFKLAEDRSTLTMADKGASLEEGDVAKVIELSDTVMELNADGAVLKLERVRE